MHSWTQIVQKLNNDLMEEKQKRIFISTTLSDSRHVIREQKKYIKKLEKKYDRLKNRLKIISEVEKKFNKVKHFLTNKM